MLRRIWLRLKFGEIFWGEIKIDALKGGGGYKQKGNDCTIFSPSNSESNKWLLQMQNKYPDVELHYLPDYLFNTYYLSTLFSAYCNIFLIYICRE